MTSDICFIYDDKAFFTNQKCFIIVGNDIKYLCEQLNKKYMRLYYTFILPKLGSDGYELSKIFMEKVPIPLRGVELPTFSPDELKFIDSQ